MLNLALSTGRDLGGAVHGAGDHGARDHVHGGAADQGARSQQRLRRGARGGARGRAPPVAAQGRVAGEHSILVAPQSAAALEQLLALAEPLARSEPRRELILARLVRPPRGAAVRGGLQTEARLVSEASDQLQQQARGALGRGPGRARGGADLGRPRPRSDTAVPQRGDRPGAARRPPATARRRRSPRGGGHGAERRRAATSPSWWRARAPRSSPVRDAR